MKFKRPSAGAAQGDLTPMIDMTFQLIAFFMVLINFTEADTNERIKLPTSEIVKPPDGPMEEPIFLHLTAEGTVILGGVETTIEGAKANLIVEANILKRKDSSPANATVIVRGDADVPAGEVQKLIQICQEAEFETFALRAEEKYD
jgi:biopolymer transport protein ExbD